jgi:hypothetical protein
MYFGLVKMTRYQLSDEQIRDHLCQTATLIQKARYFVSTLADDLVRLPKNEDARSQLIDSSMNIQAALAEELDAMRKVLESVAFTAMFN